MAANSTLDLVSLDFDTLKSNLKNFLQSQAVFKDYDFNGSNLGVLIDLLSYNTFLNGFYLNMIASESFLDSAQLRDSIVSHAKELNYLPRSAKSSQITLEPFRISLRSDAMSLIMPKGTRFSGVSKGVSYNFVTAADYINNTPVYNASANTNDYYVSARALDQYGTSYIVNPFIIYQGNYQTDTFVVNYSLENQRFVLTDSKVDTDSITVTVTEDSGASIYNYIYSSTLLDVKATDPRFFIQPADSGKYEILFGDDIIGRRPRNSAVVTVNYRTTSGAAGNGITNFSLDTNVGTTSGSEISGTLPKLISSSDIPGGSYGGADSESVDQIRYKAPRYFQTQERAVTASDYKILLQNAFPEISAIQVFGGETFDPPLYGKVYISVKLQNIDGLPNAKVLQYMDFIKQRSPLSIDAVFISPESLYYKVVTSVNYNINVTPKRPDQIKSIVISAIQAYDAANFETFNVTLRKSKLQSDIDSSDVSIISNDTSLLIFKKITPFLGVSQNIVIRLGIPIVDNLPKLPSPHLSSKQHAVHSTPFVYNGQTCVMEDDAEGILRIVSHVSDYDILVIDIGTVDYASGTITINNFNIDSFSGNEIRIYATPKYADISVVGNNVLELALDELTVTVNSLRQ
jgi:Baseplate J-like protein